MIATRLPEKEARSKNMTDCHREIAVRFSGKSKPEHEKQWWNIDWQLREIKRTDGFA